MEPEFEPMLPPEPRSGGAPAPAVGVAARRRARRHHRIRRLHGAVGTQLYLEGETARLDVTQQRDRLKANVADLTRQVEQANRSRDEVENALKQSRANTEAASAQIADLQKQVSDLQQKSSDFENARAAAEASGKEAASAKEALAREVATLKGQLGDDAEEAQSGARRPEEGARASQPRAMPPPAAPPGP